MARIDAASFIIIITIVDIGIDASYCTSRIMKHKKLLLCLVLFAYLALCTVLCSASCSTTSHFSSASSANSALERWRTNTANCLRCHKVVSLKRKSKSSLGSIQINAEHSPTFHRPSTSLKSINVLMLLFYGTLGSVMPYLPIFYKHIGANGEFSVISIFYFIGHY